MVKLYVVSDLHLENAGFAPDPAVVSAADVVVLAGDIHPGVEGVAWARSTFPDKPIVLVAGNHEFYGGDWDEVLQRMRQAAKTHDVHFLENTSVTVAGIRFVGCTLWTDFAYFGEHLVDKMMDLAEQGLPDYREIRANGLGYEWGFTTRLIPRMTLERHEESRAWLTAELALGDPARTVVVTHHLPHKHSVAAKYASDGLTPAFASNLPVDLMVQARLWIHGHSHDSCNYRLGDSQRHVRVLCNPRGYPFGWLPNEWENPRFNPDLLMTLLPNGDWAEGPNGDPYPCSSIAAHF